MLHKDEWLSGFFPAGAYVYKAPYAEEPLPAGFISAKVPAHDTAAVNSLTGRGFFLVETLLHFRQHKPLPAATGTVELRAATADDEKAVTDLAATAFTQSRFYKDGMIPDTVASALKRAWVANFFHGKRGDKMIVASVNGQPVGFNLLMGNTIDLIAVHPDHYRKGIGAAMIARANEDIGPLHAGTQIVNGASLALYQKAGFRLDNAAYVFHRHA